MTPVILSTSTALKPAATGKPINHEGHEVRLEYSKAEDEFCFVILGREYAGQEFAGIASLP
jgi:hypothetical protein